MLYFLNLKKLIMQFPHLYKNLEIINYVNSKNNVYKNNYS